jgi:4-diphosphocytidyl-2-C-methyl-D-erythritol kinase
MKEYKLLSPAKINLRLEVLNKREDGYHDIRTILTRISLYDDVYISLKKEKGISVKSENVDIPENRNLAFIAAKYLLEEAGIDTGVDIRIKKRIPVGGGLGGGSSNAATIIMALNELLNINLSDKGLMDIGLKIGTDVPFFIFKKPAIATGIGDILEEITIPPNLWFVLINPDICINTGDIYKKLLLTNSKIGIKLPYLFKDCSQIVKILYNDLERVTINMYPVIGEIKNRLLSLGAEGTLMSGSGSTVFAIFSDKDRALRSINSLNNIFNKVFLVNNI